MCLMMFERIAEKCLTIIFRKRWKNADETKKLNLQILDQCLYGKFLQLWTDVVIILTLVIWKLLYKEYLELIYL